MSDKNNIKYYEKIIILEDEIYDSDALDNYDAFYFKMYKIRREKYYSIKPVQERTGRCN